MSTAGLGRTAATTGPCAVWSLTVGVTIRAEAVEWPGSKDDPPTLATIVPSSSASGRAAGIGLLARLATTPSADRIVRLGSVLRRDSGPRAAVGERLSRRICADEQWRPASGAGPSAPRTYDPKSEPTLRTTPPAISQIPMVASPSSTGTQPVIASPYASPAATGTATVTAPSHAAGATGVAAPLTTPVIARASVAAPPVAPPLVRPAGTGTAPPAVGAARVSDAVRTARATVAGVGAATRGPRRARLHLKRVDPWSVMKFAFAVSLVLFVVAIVATSVLYLALDAMGVFESLNGALADMTGEAGGATGCPEDHREGCDRNVGAARCREHGAVHCPDDAGRIHLQRLRGSCRRHRAHSLRKGLNAHRPCRLTGLGGRALTWERLHTCGNVAPRVTGL